MMGTAEDKVDLTRSLPGFSAGSVRTGALGVPVAAGTPNIAVGTMPTLRLLTSMALGQSDIKLRSPHGGPRLPGAVPHGRPGDPDRAGRTSSGLAGRAGPRPLRRVHGAARRVFAVW